MRIAGSIAGDFAAILDEERRAIAAALRVGVERATTAVQNDLRGQVRGAGLGRGLENAWRQKLYGKSGSLDPAGLVFSKATLLHRVFSEGAIISAKSGRYLAIPTAEAEAAGLAQSFQTRPGPLGSTGTGGIPLRLSMVDLAVRKFGEKNIVTLPLARGRKLIAYRVPQGRGPGLSFRAARGLGVGLRRGQTIGLFILVPQVGLRSRLDLDGARLRADATLANEIASALAR